MIPLLPRWNLNPNRSSFYDRDAGTLLELAAKLHSSMNELIEDYNKFVEETNKTVTEKLTEYEQSINEGRRALRQEFQDFIDHVDMKIDNVEKNTNSITIDEILLRITNLEYTLNTGLAEINSMLTEIVGE